VPAKKTPPRSPRRSGLTGRGRVANEVRASCPRHQPASPKFANCAMSAGFSPSDANRAPNRCQIPRSAALQPAPRVHPPEPGRLHAVHAVPERIPLTPSSAFRVACCSAARPAATRGLSRIAPLARRRISPPGALSILCQGHAPDIALRLQGMLALSVRATVSRQQ
jgi:hypothetical protein